MNADTDAYSDRIDELETTLARNKSADAQRAPYEAQLNNGGVARDLLGGTNMNQHMNPPDSEIRGWILGRSPERHLVVSLPETRDPKPAT